MNSTKKDLKRKENLERLTNAINSLETLSRNNNVQRNLRSMIKDVSVMLRDEKSGNSMVRAANAISMLDTITQNPQMQSHIRTMLWQVVSTLESIRE
ncbi:MAG TPA: UPF0147 family protein [Nitrososphaeraceae archaeon]|nr:UPF0147 family protein [Nitrososphaeraceae archaeon]